MNSFSTYSSIRSLARVIALCGVVTMAAGIGGICSTSTPVRTYPELLGQAINEIDQGQYNAAVKTLDEALVLQPGEPLGRLALATVLAHTRKVDLAVEEYQAVLTSDQGNALAHYGLATCLLSSGQVEKARAQFVQAGSAGADALVYVDYLAGRVAGKADSSTLLGMTGGALGMTDRETDVVALVAIDRLRKQRQQDQAQELVLGMIEKAKVPGYQEDHGALVTLDRKSPVEFSGEPLARLPQMRVSADKSLPKVKGRTLLKPDGPTPVGAQFALFQIDGALAAMVNQEPFHYDWDTTRCSNGVHTISVSVQYNTGDPVPGKTRKVWVQNLQQAKPKALQGPDVERMQSVLWERMRLRPSLKALYYSSGKSYLLSGDTAAAEPLLEKAAACDPHYQDVRQLLRRCYRREGYTEVKKGPSGGKTIALTFDDGPNSSTQAVLDILDQFGVKATFFVVGSQVELHRDLVRSMAENGHQIEGHTFSHRNMTQLSEREAEREFLRCAAAIRDATGKRSSYFRPPGGHLSKAAETAAARFGLTGVFWTVLCSNFEQSFPDKMAQFAASSINDGGIILMHNGEDVTLKALPAVIQSLQGKGYRFATISELVR